VWLFEGLRAAGVRLDDTYAIEGEVQYPAETLGFRTGNKTDLGLLYAAALEASGISCAIVPLDGDFIIACHLEANQMGVETLNNVFTGGGEVDFIPAGGLIPRPLGRLKKVLNP
jgi:hypothetical protein